MRALAPALATLLFACGATATPPDRETRGATDAGPRDDALWSMRASGWTLHPMLVDQTTPFLPGVTFRPCAATHTDAAGVTLAEWRFHYDGAGRLVERTGGETEAGYALRARREEAREGADAAPEPGFCLTHALRAGLRRFAYPGDALVEETLHVDEEGAAPIVVERSRYLPNARASFPPGDPTVYAVLVQDDAFDGDDVVGGGTLRVEGEAGRQVAQAYIIPSGEGTHTASYEYDAAGRLARRGLYAEDDPSSIEHRYGYDDAGALIAIEVEERLDDATPPRRTAHRLRRRGGRVHGCETREGAARAHVTWLRDASGRLVARELVRDGAPAERWRYRYDCDAHAGER